MVSSVGFFSHFPPFRNSHNSSSSPAPFLAALAAGAAAVGLSLAASSSSVADAVTAEDSSASQIGWACLSLSNAGLSPVEPRPGLFFPQEVDGKRRLLGVGVVRRTKMFGLMSSDAYAFGVYADDSDIKKLNGKYGKSSLSELKNKEEFIADAIDSDIRMTVRLQIVSGQLEIRSIRQAFAKSVGSRLQKFGATESTNTDELLQKFVSLFKDDEKVRKGSVIELSREEGSVLRTRINRKEVGQIQSKLLCKSILDLYFGEKPVDKRAKEDIQLNLANRLKTT